MKQQSSARSESPADVTITLAPGLIDAIGDQAKQEIASVIARARQEVKRAIKRAENPAGLERVEIVQARGPTIEFWGRLLCSDEFETRGQDPMRIELELYQTKAGALIAVTASTPVAREGHEVVRATVVEAQGDEQAMRFAVLDHWDWEIRARSMVTKKLKWQLRQDVD